MRGRVEELVGVPARIMWVSTFHSACVRILRKEITQFNKEGGPDFKSSFTIYDAADSKRLMTLVCRDLELGQVDVTTFAGAQLLHQRRHRHDRRADAAGGVGDPVRHAQHPAIFVADQRIEPAERRPVRPARACVGGRPPRTPPRAAHHDPAPRPGAGAGVPVPDASAGRGTAGRSRHL